MEIKFINQKAAKCCHEKIITLHKFMPFRTLTSIASLGERVLKLGFLVWKWLKKLKIKYGTPRIKL